jgi:hypothetical protein
MLKQSTKSSEKKPPNAFLLYRSDTIRQFPPKTSRVPGRQDRISQMVGEAWKQEPEAVRQEYHRRAAAMMHEYNRLNREDSGRRARSQERRAARAKMRCSGANSTSVGDAQLQEVPTGSTGQLARQGPGGPWKDINGSAHASCLILFRWHF